MGRIVKDARGLANWFAGNALRAAAAAAAMGLCAATAAPQDAQPAKALHAPAAPARGAKQRRTSPLNPTPPKLSTARRRPANADGSNPQAAPPEPPPPYEPQVLRLSEILGALAWLDDLCGAKSDWRARMQQFLEAEAKTPERKERIAGSFNRSFHDYELSYQTCTPNAQIIISRFLTEGGRLARDIVNRFSAS